MRTVSSVVSDRTVSSVVSDPDEASKPTPDLRTGNSYVYDPACSLPDLSLSYTASPLPLGGK